jgi:hypothetical protein
MALLANIGNSPGTHKIQLFLICPKAFQLLLAHLLGQSVAICLSGMRSFLFLNLLVVGHLLPLICRTEKISPKIDV